MPRKKKQIQISTMRFQAINLSFPTHQNVKFNIEMDACETCLGIAFARCMKKNLEFRKVIQIAMAVFVEENKDIIDSESQN